MSSTVVPAAATGPLAFVSAKITGDRTVARNAAESMAAASSFAGKSDGVSELINDGIVATSSVVLIGSFFWVPACLWYVWRNKCKTRRRKALFLGCLIVILTVPLPVNRRVARLALWNRFFRYFSCTVVGDVEATRGRQSLYCLVPHGIFPLGIGLSSFGRLNETVFDGVRPVVASIMLRTPVLGQILNLIGAVKASPGAMDTALREGKSLSLAPGGIGEMFLDPNAGKEFALIKGRKGFVRRAMAHGVPLVPVFVFGNSETFKRAPLPAVLENVSRFLKASLVLFWGRWGLPIPFKVPITFAIGEALQVERNASPTPEQVDALHSRFCEELTGVFDRFKVDYGWGDKQLELR